MAGRGGKAGEINFHMQNGTSSRGFRPRVDTMDRRVGRLGNLGGKFESSCAACWLQLSFKSRYGLGMSCVVPG